MLDPPSADFAPLAELQDWLVHCQELRRAFGDDSGALADLAESEEEIRAALRRRQVESEPAIP